MNFPCQNPKRKMPNIAVKAAPFGRWTLRDKAAQRRLALRWASQGRGLDAFLFS